MQRPTRLLSIAAVLFVSLWGGVASAPDAKASSLVGPTSVRGAAGALADAAAPPSLPKPIRTASAPRSSGERDRLAVHIAATWRLPLAESRQIVDAAFRHARQHGLSPTLILAIVAQESSFRASAQSRYGARGLMQVVPRHHPEKMVGAGDRALMVPEQNIAIGATILAEYLRRAGGDVDAALTKYSGKARAYPDKIARFWTEMEQVRVS